jgi:hypothetical protein
VKHTENSLRKAKNIKINILEEKETRGHYKKSSISIIINYVCQFLVSGQILPSAGFSFYDEDMVIFLPRSLNILLGAVI